MITVHVVDEQFDEVEALDLDVDTRLLNRIVGDAEAERLCCLRFIDPYGETIFNRAQAGALIGELDWLSRRAESEGDRRLVSELRRLGTVVVDDVHLYLRFSGD